MKRIASWVLFVTLVLCLVSCSREEPWKSQILTELESEKAIDSEVESQTETVRELPEVSYTLSWDNGELHEILAWNDDILVVALNDEGLQLVRIAVDDGSIIAQTFLHTAFGIDVKVLDTQVRIYDYSTKSWTWFDEALNEVENYVFPEMIEGIPYMDAAGKLVYYVSNDYQLIQYDRFTGVKSIINSGFEDGSSFFLEELIKGGAIAVVSSYVEDLDGMGGYCMHFIDTKTREVLYETDEYLSVYGDEDYYCSLIYGDGRQFIYGRYNDKDVRELIFENYDAYDCLYGFPEMARVVTWTKTADDMGSFSLYSMEDGRKISEYTTAVRKDMWGSSSTPWQMICLEGDQTMVYLLNGDYSQIYVWNPISSVCEDENDYSRAYLLWDARDEEEYMRLRERAYAIGKQYGVFIYVSDLCPTDYYGYVAERSHSVRAIEHGLNIVEKALSAYPAGFFQQLSENPRGKLKICLVDALYPSGADSLETTTALFNYDDSSQAIVLSLSAMSDIEDLFYHEVSHAIDMKLYDTDYQQYTDGAWDALNPEGFSYDNSYTDNAATADGSYVVGWGDEAYFVDSYSKSFATEDRARLMEFAIGKYPETDCFGSEYILAKLKHRSEAIRAAFDTTGWPEVTSWERPLQ